MIVWDSLFMYMDGFYLKTMNCTLQTWDQLLTLLSDLLKSIGTLSICPGVKPFELSSSILHHVIPKSVDPLLNDDDDGSSFPHQEYWRTHGCAVLFDNGKQCCSCHHYSHKSELSHMAKQKKLAEPAHLFSPVSQTTPERIKLTLQMQRFKCAELEQKLEEMKLEIQKSKNPHPFRNSSLTPYISLKFLVFETTPPGISNPFCGGSMDIFWNYTLNKSVFRYLSLVFFWVEKNLCQVFFGV